MNAITTKFSNADLSTIRASIAKDCNRSEFDLYVKACKSYGLDPFRRQLIPVVFNKNREDRRAMSLIVTRDGLRVIAQRCGNYRPKAKAADFLYDQKLKSELNPAGIVRASVELYKQDKQGQWWPIYGEAYWDEYAPTENEWGYDKESNKRTIVGKRLPEMWGKMPRVMIEKCAEAAALRAGWPEQFAGLYSEEEMAQKVAEDRAASDLADEADKEMRLKAVKAKDTILTNFGDGLEAVPVGQYYDRWMRFIEATDNPTVVTTVSEQNHAALRQFWSHEPDAALELRSKLEKIAEDKK